MACIKKSIATVAEHQAESPEKKQVTKKNLATGSQSHADPECRKHWHRQLSARKSLL